MGDGGHLATRMRGWRWLWSALLGVACLVAAPRAKAGKTTGGSPVWELPRSPFVPHRATPSALECDLDEDDDGLDDEVEGLLAEHFVPVIRFSVEEQHREPNNPKFPGNQEPFVAFNAWPQ